jgi:hypothetical protein
MRLTLQFFSCIFRHFKNALTGGPEASSQSENIF